MITENTNLNKLDYPMFKITLNEAWLLTEALRYLRKRKDLLSCHYLCGSLDMVADDYPSEKNGCRKLGSKLMVSLNGYSTLHAYFNIFWDDRSLDEVIQKLRRIWIKKLLKHNGY